MTLTFDFECNIRTAFATPPKSYLLPVTLPSLPPTLERLSPVICHDVLVEEEAAAVKQEDTTQNLSPAPPLPKAWKKNLLGGLRVLCEERGLSTHGTKTDLIARLEEWRA